MINKIIIYLFEKYAFDEWVDKQQKEAREDFKKKYNLKDNEVEEAMIDRQQEPLKEAYDAGCEDGYEKGHSNALRGR